MDSRVKRRAILFSMCAVVLIVGVTFLGNASTLRRYLPDWMKGGKPPAVDSAENRAETESEPGSGSESAGGFVTDGFAGADPALQMGSDLRAFLNDATFFDKELSSYEKELLDGKRLSFVTVSVERDLRVQIRDSAGDLATGVPFVIHLKEQGNYVDQDKDGVIYVNGLDAGEYEMTLTEAGEFEPPKPIVVSVRDQVEHAAIADIKLLMRTEEDLQAQEDAEGRGEAADGDETESFEVRNVGEEGQMGIDVSKQNGEIDWDRVKSSGIDFAIIRCGYRGYVTGELVEDPYFEKNMRGALAAGLKVGAYFSTQATTEVEAVEEASMAIALSREYKLAYPIFASSGSAGGNGRADSLGMEARTKLCQAFCETVEDAGVAGGIRGSRTWFRTKLRMDMLSEHIIWLAEYREKPVYAGNYHFWQYTGSGSVDGVEGSVGLNIGYLAY